MFAYVAAGLGNCTAIKEEDAGELYCHDSSVVAPDFRVMILDGEEVLVEVKNHRPTDPAASYPIEGDYIDRLKRYAAIFKRPLYFAIFWSQARLWTLVQPKDFLHNGNRYALPPTEAMLKNQMGLLGDMMIGTLPSLTLKVYSDPAKPRAISADGTVSFTISRAELHCDDHVLTDTIDSKIAWFLMNYGDWPCAQAPAEVRDGLLVSAALTVAPEERSNSSQSFECIGFLSQMLSRKFNDVTTRDGQVSLLSPKADPGTLSVAIPPDHNSEALPLWRFKIACGQTDTQAPVATS
jgi:hypothetical protein